MKKIKFSVVNLSIKENDKNWDLKIKNKNGLTEAKLNYTVEIKIDEDYFNERIERQKKQIREANANNDLFDDYKKTTQLCKDTIKEIENEQKDFEDFNIEEFETNCRVADFKADTLILLINDETVKKIIDIRKNIDAFAVYLS